MRLTKRASEQDTNLIDMEDKYRGEHLIVQFVVAAVAIVGLVKSQKGSKLNSVIKII